MEKQDIIACGLEGVFTKSWNARNWTECIWC